MLLGALALALLIGAPSAGASGLFSRLPGEMLHGRYTPAAGVLPDGTVLIAGGYDEHSSLASAEIYDPASGTYSKLSSEETGPRGDQATVALPDGRIAMFGGTGTETLRSVELFDPVTRTFSLATGNMSIKRDGPGAALLPSGEVLVAGGENGVSPIPKSAEIYDPATQTFTPVKGEMQEGRWEPVVVALPDGKVLIAGGYSGEPEAKYLQTAEIYDPSTETFRRLEGAGHVPAEPRDAAGGVTLQNGRVLIAGGYNATKKNLASAEYFDYASETFSAIPGAALAEAREGPSAVVLRDGRALFIGGYDDTLPVEHRYPPFVDVTAVAPAVAATLAPSAVALTTATVHGNVETEALASAWFQMGTTTAYGTSTPLQTLHYAAAPQPLAASLAGLAPGTTYHFRVVAQNAGGTVYGADQTFTTAPPIPALAAVRQARVRWRAGSALAKISRRGVPVGTTFSLTLNTAAKVSFAFTQRAGGRRLHGRCVAQTHRNRDARRCSRSVTRGTLSFSGHAGVNKVVFQGRVSRKVKLRPGTYTLVISAAGPSGTSAPQLLTFTIVG